MAITGGEPFVRPDFFEFLERVHERQQEAGFQWFLLSNGSLLTEENLIRLKELGIKSYQVSMEGTKDKTDEMMGKGCFDKAVNAIKLLVAANVPAVVSLTLSKKNMKTVPDLVDICLKLGVKSLGTRRLIPWGRGKEMEEYMLSPKELRDYYLMVKDINKSLRKDRKNFKIEIGCESGIFNEEIIKDVDSEMGLNLCGVTCGRCLTIMANGDLMHCRRLPIPMGNALKDNLYDVWYSKPMQELRSLDKIDPVCKECDNFINCFGGARCVTYAYTGELHAKDVQCWRNNLDSK
jgi:radical SAM protein with 4Fe4S-binding SPASM domain